MATLSGVSQIPGKGLNPLEKTAAVATVIACLEPSHRMVTYPDKRQRRIASMRWSKMQQAFSIRRNYKSKIISYEEAVELSKSANLPIGYLEPKGTFYSSLTTAGPSEVRDPYSFNGLRAAFIPGQAEKLDRKDIEANPARFGYKSNPFLSTSSSEQNDSSNPRVRGGGHEDFDKGSYSEISEPIAPTLYNSANEYSSLSASQIFFGVCVYAGAIIGSITVYFGVRKLLKKQSWYQNMTERDSQISNVEISNLEQKINKILVNQENCSQSQNEILNYLKNKEK